METLCLGLGASLLTGLNILVWGAVALSIYERVTERREKQKYESELALKVHRAVRNGQQQIADLDRIVTKIERGLGR